MLQTAAIEAPVRFTPEPIGIYSPIPDGMPNAAPLAPHTRPSRLRRAAVAFTVALALGACDSPKAPDVTPTPPAPTTEATTLITPAKLGKLPMGVVIVGIANRTLPSRGYTRANVTQFTTDSEVAITEATSGKVQFAPPAFYGRIELQMDHPENACRVSKDQLLDGAFSTELRNDALAAATKAGYNPHANLGLNVFVDYACASPIRSNYGGAPFIDGLSLLHAPATKNDMEPVEEHELGHNLGLAHANRYDCLKGPGVMFASCALSEYGNPRSIMGSMYELPGGAGAPRPAFNGYELYRLGAIKPDQIWQVNGPGNYEIDLGVLDPNHFDTQLIRIPRVMVDAAGKQTISYFWFEYSKAPRNNKYVFTPSCERIVTDRTEEECTDPRDLSVVTYETDEGGNRLPPSGTLMLPLSRLEDKGMGGSETTQKGNPIFRDTVTDTTVTIEQTIPDGNRPGYTNGVKLLINYRGPAVPALNVN